MAPISSVVHGIDAEVLLDHRDGMPRACAANLDIMATVRRRTLMERITQLSDERMVEVDRAIHLALGIPLPCELR